MCISDYRIARFVTSKATNWNTTGPVNTTFLPNPSRVGILIGRDAAALGITSCTVVTFDNGAALILASAVGYALLKIEDYGSLILRGFTITAIATQHTGVTTEFELPPGFVLADATEFKRSYL